jgi:hypothetical protein
MKIHQFVALATAILGLVACASPTTTNDTGKTGGTPTASGHDGTVSAPTVLTLDTPFSGKVGATSDFANSESFYKFTTGSSDTSLLIAVNQATPAHTGTLDWDLRVYSDAAMNTQLLAASPNDNIAPYLTGLTASTTYYAKLYNKTSSAATFKITAQVPPVYKHDASMPIFMNGSTTGTASMVVTSLTGEDISTYYFTATQTGTATITYPEGILDGTLYSDNTYSTWVADETSSSTSTKSFTASVTKDAAYFLKIRHWGSAVTRITGTLTVAIQ